MKIWLHKTGKWYHYFRSKWLNSISWEEGQPKIYRWLFWGYCKKSKTKTNFNEDKGNR